MSYYEPPERDDDEPLATVTELQPDDFCECRPGVELRHGWQHAAECLRWSPPLTGPGSTDEHRTKALAHIRAQIDDAKRRHQDVTR